MSEAGIPGYELTNWFGLSVPGDTLAELVARIRGDQTRIRQKEIRERLVDMGADVVAKDS